MTYEVYWKRQALNELDEIWKSAADKEGIENTATRINIELTHKPLDAGESRIAGIRIHFKYPLVVYFQVHPRLPLVIVTHVYCPHPF